MPQWSQSAYRHGDNVAKYGVFPLGEAQKKIENEAIKEDDPINCISQFNRVFHMTHKVTYKFCAQMLQNLDEQPVDDIGIEWNEEKYPMEQVRVILNPRTSICRLLTECADRDSRVRATGLLAARVPHVVGRQNYVQLVAWPEDSPATR